MKSLELRSERHDILTRAQSIHDRAANANRDLTAAEKKEFDTILNKVRALDLQIERQERDESTPASAAQLSTMGPGRQSWYGDASSSLVDARALNRARGETFASRARATWNGDADPHQMDFGRFVRGCVTGQFDRRDLAYQDTMSTTLGSGGGYLVPAPLSALVLDALVAQTVVSQSGAVIIPMESSTLDVARVTDLPDVAWKAENAAASFSDVSIGKLVFHTRTLVGLTRASVELIEDAGNSGTVISSALATSLALEVDRACILGNGAGSEPLGLVNTPGVNSTAIGGTLMPDHLIDGVGAIRGRNVEPNALLWHPDRATAFEKSKDGDGSYQVNDLPPTLRDLPKRTSTQITSSLAILGDFTRFAVGARTQLTIEVSRDASDSNASAFTNLQVWIRAYLRMDCGPLYESGFQVLTGIS